MIILLSSDAQEISQVYLLPQKDAKQLRTCVFNIGLCDSECSINQNLCDVRSLYGQDFNFVLNGSDLSYILNHELPCTDVGIIRDFIEYRNTNSREWQNITDILTHLCIN